ncbi:MAG: hypothetical protein AVDCRST_MAG05-3076, partial [uncultured Rubrobacteraceae bacterium]
GPGRLRRCTQTCARWPDGGEARGGRREQAGLRAVHRVVERAGVWGAGRGGGPRAVPRDLRGLHARLGEPARGCGLAGEGGRRHPRPERPHRRHGLRGRQGLRAAYGDGDEHGALLRGSPHRTRLRGEHVRLREDRRRQDRRADPAVRHPLPAHADVRRRRQEGGFGRGGRGPPGRGPARPREAPQGPL